MVVEFSESFMMELESDALFIKNIILWPKNHPNG